MASGIPSKGWEPLCKSLSMENRGTERFIDASQIARLVCWRLEHSAPPCSSSIPHRSCWGPEHRTVEGREHPVADEQWVQQDPGQHLAFIAP